MLRGVADPASALSLAASRAALDSPDEALALRTLALLSPLPHERAEAAAVALRLGRPRHTLDWAIDPLVRAAAWLRLGEAQSALGELGDDRPPCAREAVLRARADWQLRLRAAAEPESGSTDMALRLARQEGDAGALVAAATLRGEELIRAGERFAALRALAEGLKVAELGGQTADAHLLAVLAHAQGGAKGGRTAEKALARSGPGSPARVLALLALARPADAQSQAAAGDLSPLWWTFVPPA